MTTKILFATVVIATVMILGIYKVSAQTKKEAIPMENSKILIAYYSWSGNTKEVAEAIHKQTGGEMFEIQTVQSYPEEYKATTVQAKKEINEGYRPELKDKVANMAQYDVIFIGSPNWWGTITPAVSSFLESYDFEGKTIVPFITHGGGGVQNTIKDMTAQCKGCNVVQDGWVGYSSRTFGVKGWLEDVFKNLKKAD